MHLGKYRLKVQRMCLAVSHTGGCFWFPAAYRNITGRTVVIVVTVVTVVIVVSGDSSDSSEW